MHSTLAHNQLFKASSSSGVSAKRRDEGKKRGVVFANRLPPAGGFGAKCSAFSSSSTSSFPAAFVEKKLFLVRVDKSVESDEDFDEKKERDFFDRDAGVFVVFVFVFSEGGCLRDGWFQS